MFSLEQANNKQGPGWYIWQQADEYPSREMAAFRAVEAARRQGEEAFDSMRMALMDGRHLQRKDFTNPEHIDEMARAARLDMARFKRELPEVPFRLQLAEDHMNAVKLGIFGTPTMVFLNGSQFFFRIKAHEDPKEALRAFDLLYETMVLQDNFDEIKRPHPPQA